MSRKPTPESFLTDPDRERFYRYGMAPSPPSGDCWGFLNWLRIHHRRHLTNP